MNQTSPLTAAQTAAQDLLARTQVATRHFVDTVGDSTERFSAEVTTSARDAADTVRSKAEPTAEQVNGAIADLIAWARRNSDRFIADLDEFRNGLEARLAPVTVVTKADLAALEARMTKTERAVAKAIKTSSTPTKTTKSAAKTTKAKAAKSTPKTTAATTTA